MPIYEFKCANCGECSELLVINKEENIEIKCASCSSKELERIISSTNYSVAGGSSVQDKNCSNSNTTRTCSSGSCTTYNIPGLA